MDENRITGAAKEFGGKVEGKAGNISGDRRTKAEGKATELKGKAETLVGHAKDSLSDVADQATEFAQSTLKQGRERFPGAERAYRQGNHALSSYAKEAPLLLAAMAGAIGYLLAMVIHGRR